MKLSEEKAIKYSIQNAKKACRDAMMVHPGDVAAVLTKLDNAEDTISSMSGVVNTVWKALDTMYMMATDYLNEMQGEMHEDFFDALEEVGKAHSDYDPEPSVHLDNDGDKYS